MENTSNTTPSYPLEAPNENDDATAILQINQDIISGQGGPESSNKRIILQKFTIYNSCHTMYIVGSNAKESLFRIIEISCEAGSDFALTLLEDKSYFYTRKDMAELLDGLNESIEGGIHRITQAFGLLGFIKFTRGYYLSVITKCSQVAVLGGHFIYHVDETKLIPLEFNYRRPEKYSDEDRLLSIFKYLDLGKTFYFSYTYDVTNSLQTNILRQRTDTSMYRESHKKPSIGGTGVNERFIWNNLLLKPILNQVDFAAFDWFQPIIHGFVDQANISIYGRKIYITIIARRSHHFAGARFLKRGVNDTGNVANEVETEQIVSDMLTSSFHDSKHGFYKNSRYTSFVQHRGSIPLYWTQDLNRLPKPPIEINLSDPFYQSSGIHFNNLFQRYGQPIIILNLIKTKEKQPRESKLNHHFENCIKYLNQFLPTDKKLIYQSFDMSKHSKKNLDVISPLQNIAKEAIRKTGFFHNGHDLNSTKIQQGVVRTNCIDCLDRTNAAQFIICKEALSQQLQSLGFISSLTDLDYDSDLINILTEIFHDHGDTIAVQYGGSNLVNTMDSYRRINQWSSHTRDMLNSIKRIYSNSFMDSIRQEAINLFLGNYVYDPEKLKLWEMQNDYYLHNQNSQQNALTKTSYKVWFNMNFLRSRAELIDKELHSSVLKRSEQQEANDFWFNECYGSRNFQSFLELFQFNMNSNVRYFPSNSSIIAKNFDYSPFESRKPYFKKTVHEDSREQYDANLVIKEDQARSEEHDEPSIGNHELNDSEADSPLKPENYNGNNSKALKLFLQSRLGQLAGFRSGKWLQKNVLKEDDSSHTLRSECDQDLSVSDADLSVYRAQFQLAHIPCSASAFYTQRRKLETSDSDLKVYLNASKFETKSNLADIDSQLYYAYTSQLY